MSASVEWTDWHLSSAGWVPGDQKRDNGLQTKPPPTDRALTMRFIEECNGYGPVVGRHHEQWRSDDLALVNLLLNQFGKAPSDL